MNSYLCFKFNKPLAERSESNVSDLYSTYPFSIYEVNENMIDCIECQKKTKYITINNLENKIKCTECNKIYQKNILTNKVMLLDNDYNISICEFFCCCLFC